MKRILIIGAGPAGLFSAYLLAKRGFNVQIIEEHTEIGLPIQCTGLATKTIKKILPYIEGHSCIKNVIQKIKVTTNNSVSLQIPTYELVLNRKTFDQHLGKLAEKAGAKILCGYSFTGKSPDAKAEIINKKTGIKEKVDYDILIGADGPLSKTAKSFFPKNKLKYYTGIQAIVKGKFENDTYDVFVGDAFPDFFGWCVPESITRARIGLAAKIHTKKHFDALCKKLNIKKKDILEYQGGLIPIYNSKNKIHTKYKNKHIFLIGDAAGQVKSTTGGGIVPLLQYAKYLTDCINKKQYSNYSNSIWQKENRGLFLHLIIRKMLDDFNDNDYKKLIRILSSRKATRILGNTSRDNVVTLSTRLILANPLHVLYAPRFLKALISTVFR
jgi:digeranylgeranylglycerophospholipid reductase